MFGHMLYTKNKCNHLGGRREVERRRERERDEVVSLA